MSLTDSAGSAQRRCVFCKIVDGRAPAHRIFEDEHFLVFLDIYPVRPGHTLVIPKGHGQYLRDLGAAGPGQLFSLGAKVGEAIRRSGLPCDDINFLLNDGQAANQTVPHVHLHLLPRVRADLHKVARMLLQRPVQAFLGQADDHVLQANATLIRSAL